MAPQINPAWLAAFILVALLLTGLVSKKDFQQKIDWPMIFFLLSLEGLSRSISYLGLDTALSAAVGDRFDFVGGNLVLFIPVALAVTLVLRLALPITRRHGGGGGGADAGGRGAEHPPLGAGPS